MVLSIELPYDNGGTPSTEESMQTGIFHHLHNLPMELRFLVYSRMPMCDRVSASRASYEMESYFVKYKLEGNNSIYLVEKEGVQYLKMVYKVTGVDGWTTVPYTQMHQVPEETLPSIQYELESAAGCGCKFCEDTVIRQEKGEEVRYFRDGNLDAVFHGMRLFDTTGVELKSSPIGGLVDLLQPTGNLVGNGATSMRINWHPKPSDFSIRNDPRINMDNWKKWFESFSVDTFYFFNDSPDVYIHRDLFDLEVVKKASAISSACNADVNYRQLINLRGYLVQFCEPLNFLTPMDMLDIYKKRIQQWIRGERRSFEYEFDCVDSTLHPPHMDPRRLFANMEEEMNPERFRVYLNCPLLYVFEYGQDSILIRNMEEDEFLVISATKLVSEDTYSVYWDEEDDFPEYLRF